MKLKQAESSQQELQTPYNKNKLLINLDRTASYINLDLDRKL